jgi:hypothetical protein
MKIIFSVIIIFSFLTTQSQEYDRGRIYLNDSTSKRGYIMLKKSGKVKFKLKKKSKVIKYDKSDYYGIDLDTDYKKYRYVSDKNNPEPRLLNYELSGRLPLYSKEIKGANLVMPEESGIGPKSVNGLYINTVYFIKVNDELIRLGVRLKNKHLKYFENCPTLLSKIEADEFNRNQIKQIVAFYNKSCEW